MKWITIGAAVSALLFSSGAQAVSTPAQRCEAGKIGAAGKYAGCLHKAQQKLVAGGGTDLVKYEAALAKCEEKYSAKWDAIVTAADGQCAVTGDKEDIKEFLGSCIVDAQEAMSGDEELPPDCSIQTCGNGTTEFGETCDGTDLHGKTCASQAPATPYGTLGCSNDCLAFDTTGCVARFDASGPTIIDYKTNLEWEKKNASDGTPDFANPHDVNNMYPWGTGAAPGAGNGPAFAEFLANLNGGGPLGEGVCYADHCDWRLPTIEELLSITRRDCLDYPCVADPVFEPTWGNTWSSTTANGASYFAQIVNFEVGYTGPEYKYADWVGTRAVRSRFVDVPETTTTTTTEEPTTTTEESTTTTEEPTTTTEEPTTTTEGPTTTTEGPTTTTTLPPATHPCQGVWSGTYSGTQSSPPPPHLVSGTFSFQVDASGNALGLVDGFFSMGGTVSESGVTTMSIPSASSTTNGMLDCADGSGSGTISGGVVGTWNATKL